MTKFLHSKSLAFRLQLAIGFLLILGSALSLALVGPKAREAMETSYMEGYQQQANMAVSAMDEAYQRVQYPLNLGLKALERAMAGRPPAEATDEVVDATGWLHPGLVATVFTKEGPGKYVRQATTVKNKQGTRAVGTSLTNDAVVTALDSGQPWEGRVDLFGGDYLVRYVPLKDAQGAVAGALFVGVDATQVLTDALHQLEAIKVGETGYFFALESTGEKKGELTLHPSLKGKNLLEAKDAHGQPFIKTMLDQGQGRLLYGWKNPGEAEAREKFVVFATSKTWGQTIAASGYVEDLSKATQGIVYLLEGAQAVLVVSLLVVIALVVRSQVSRPLQEVEVVLGQLANGIIPQLPAGQRSHNEVSNIKASLAEATQSIGMLIGAVRDAVDQSTVGARELASANQELASRTESQAATVEETSAATRALATTVEGSAETTKEAQRAARTAALKAEQSGHSMQQLLTSMQDIDRSSTAVGALTSEISQIAFQTNILSLNASIEAARAGEHGRGFAVVAQEVRALAGRTAAAAKAVDRLVGESMESSRQGAELASGAAVAVAAVVQAIEQSRALTDAVATSAQEQRTTIAEIAAAVSQLDQVTQQNAAMVEEVSASANTLADQASDLGAVVSRFQVTQA